MSVAMRLPETQKEFHAGAEESISDFFFRNNFLSSASPPIEVCEKYADAVARKGGTQQLQAPPRCFCPHLSLLFQLPTDLMLLITAVPIGQKAELQKCQHQSSGII